MTSPKAKNVADFQSFADTIETVRINMFREQQKQFTDTDSVQKTEASAEIKQPEPIKSPKFKYLENFQVDDFCLFNHEHFRDNLNRENWREESTELCTRLIQETIAFCIDQKFTNGQGVAAMEMMYQIVTFFVRNVDVREKDLHRFFREMILLYAVDDVPRSMRVFMPEECLKLAEYFAEKIDFMLKFSTGR